MENIKDFARAYINDARERTSERQRIIKETYFKVTGRRLRSSCGTCHIEAIFTILKSMEKPNRSYELKRGCIIQLFGVGIITNDNLTDDLAEQALRERAATLNMFARVPLTEQETDLEIVPADGAEPEKRKRGRKKQSEITE